MTQNLLLPPLETYEAFEGFIKEFSDLEKIPRAIIERHNVQGQTLERFSEGTNLVFSLDDALVIKVFPPCHKDQYQRDALVMQKVYDALPVQTPRVLYAGEMDGWPYLIMTQLEGTLLEGLWETLEEDNKRVLIGELGNLISCVHALPTDGLEEIDCHWETFITRQIARCEAYHRAQNLPDALVAQIPAFLKKSEGVLRSIKTPVLLTGEYTPMNLLVQNIKGVWHLAGLIDFGDAMLGFAPYDLLGPGAFLIQGNRGLLKAFLMAYGYPESALDRHLSACLMALLLLHQYSNLNAQIRIQGWQEKAKTLEELADLVWGVDAQNVS